MSRMTEASVFTLVLLCFCIQKGLSVEHYATIGQEITIPCGVRSMQNVTRVAWKIGQRASTSEQLAFRFEGRNRCDTTKKNCDLSDNGDLVLHDVKEVDGDVQYFCFLNNEQYYAEHTLNIRPEVPPPTLEGCPMSDAVSVSKLDESSQRLLAYTNPVCRNSEDVFGRVTCDPPSGANIDSRTTKVVCTCSYLGYNTDTCEMSIPASPPTFEDCPMPDAVSVSKLDDSSQRLLAYTNPVCRNSEGALGGVSCDPPSGAHIYSSDTKIVCDCTYSGRHSDTCEMPIPADRTVPRGGPSFVGGIFVGLAIAFIIVLVGLVVWRVVCPCIRRRRESMSPEAQSSNQTSSQDSGGRAAGTSQTCTYRQTDERVEIGETDGLLDPTRTETTCSGSPTDENEVNEQVAQQVYQEQQAHPPPSEANGESPHPTQPEEMPQDTHPPTIQVIAQTAKPMSADEVLRETQPQTIQVNGQTAQPMPAGEVQQERPETVPVNGQTVNGQTQPTPAGEVPQHTHPQTVKGNIYRQESTHESTGYQESVPPDTPETRSLDLRVLNCSSRTTVTSPPEFRSADLGSDEVDLSDIASSTIMEVLMLDFSSGPKMKVLPLKDILPDGMEIRSCKEDFFQVIRKTEEDPEVALICKKDGHHWEIAFGEQLSFYVSCGQCKKGCFLVEMSDGGKPHEKKDVQ